MTLPGELRNEIYELALLSPHQIIFKKGWEEHSLLYTSKEIRTEARSLYYKGNRFLLIVKELDFEPASVFLDRLVFDLGTKAFGQVHFHFRRPSFTDLHKISRLVQLMRRTGIDLQAAEISWQKG